MVAIRLVIRPVETKVEDRCCLAQWVKGETAKSESEDARAKIEEVHHSLQNENALSRSDSRSHAPVRGSSNAEGWYCR